MAPVALNTVCFRYVPADKNEEQINVINEKLNHHLNDSGKLYLTHTVLNSRYTLRMVTAQTNVTREHVEKAWDFIIRSARNLTC
jgi:aromatic-L-amino-acid decarboxylase